MASVHTSWRHSCTLFANLVTKLSASNQIFWQQPANSSKHSPTSRGIHILQRKAYKVIYHKWHWFQVKLDTIPVVMQFCSTRRASCCGADTQFGSLPQPGWRCVSLSEQERLGPTLVTDSTEISVYQKCLYKETLYMNWKVESVAVCDRQWSRHKNLWLTHRVNKWHIHSY